MELNQPIICPNCNRSDVRKAGIDKSKQRWYCKNCSIRFQNESKSRKNSVFISVVKIGNEIRLSSALVQIMNLSHEDRLGIMLNSDNISVFKSKDGFPLVKERNRLKISNHHAALKLRTHFNQNRDVTFIINGNVNNNEFIGMEIITYKNSPKTKSGAKSKNPFLRTDKRNITSVSASAQTLLMLEADERIILGKENGKIFIASTKNEDGFKFHKVKFGSCVITSTGFAMELADFFKIKDTDQSYRYFLKKEPKISDGVRFFEIEKPIKI